MQRAGSSYELGRADYAWALGAIVDPPMGRGAFGIVTRAERWEESVRRWVPAVIGLVVFAGIAVFVAQRLGPTSTVAIVAYLLVPVVPGVWVAGTWVWDRLWHRVDRAVAKTSTGSLIKKIERGEAQLPLGTVEMAWDRGALRVSGSGHVVEVAWSERPIVRHQGDRVLVMPFTPQLGAPDVRQLAIVRSEAFTDRGAFEHAVEEWTSYARG